jgi:hypothetical protein
VDFEIRQDIAAPLPDVESLLADATFIEATSELAPLADCRLLDATVAESRTEVRIHRRFAADLPRVVTAVVDPRRLTWVEQVVFDHGAHTGSHRILPDHYPDLLECAYRTTLQVDGERTIRTAAGSMRVRVLIGGKQVERAIVDGLRDYAAAEAALLSSWAVPPASP